MKMWCYGWPGLCSRCARSCKGKKNNPEMMKLREAKG